MIRQISLQIIFTVFIITSGFTQSLLHFTQTGDVGVNTTELHYLLDQALEDSAWPGGVLLAAKGGKIFFQEAFGFHTIAGKQKIKIDDIFDLASITKVIGTTAAVMKLYDDGKLDLDEKVCTYLPQFSGRRTDKSVITIRHLMTHTAGLPPFKHYFNIPGDPETRIDSVLRTELEYPVGEQTIYSDVGLISLGKVVEKIIGKPMNEYLQETIYTPLGMTSTYYNPPNEVLSRIVPTEYSEKEQGYVRGHVHDENAHSIGGVAGHAGLFSTANDLAIFSQMMLNKGIYNGIRIFEEETVGLFTKRADIVTGSSRCLGWDSPSGKASGGVYLSDKSFGHTGFTGTSLWIDPVNDIFVILLTNAVHPNRASKSPNYYDWRQKIHSGVYEYLSFEKQNPVLKLRDRWWIEALPKPWLLSEREASIVLNKIQRKFPDFHDRLKAVVNWRIGTPYEIFKLGEEQEPDNDPIIRLDVSDCTAHVLTSLAFAESDSWEKARENMIHLHYKDHQPSYRTRWHFTSDRITSNPSTVNITDKLLPNNKLESVFLTLNKRADGGELLDLDWSLKIDVNYIPNSHITQSLLNKLPDVCGVAFVKKVNFKMGVIVAHEGTIIDNQYLIHASQAAGETVKLNVLDYYFGGDNPKFDGVMFYKFNPIGDRK